MTSFDRSSRFFSQKTFPFLFVFLPCLFTFSILLLPGFAHAAAYNASDLLGQLNGSSAVFTQATANAWPGDTGFSTSEGIVIDNVHHRLFVGDRTNNRVLVFNLNSDNTLPDHRADYVIGQSSFLTNSSGTTSSTMKNPDGLAYDTVHNRLFVVDENNYRVLVFDVSTISTGMSASYALGAVDLATAGAGTRTTSTLATPFVVEYDSVADRLFVGDNNRILVFNVASGTIASGMNASNVLGQVNFTASASGPNSTSTNSIYGLAYDTTSTRLFVGEYGNGRALVFNAGTSTITNGEAASFVIGAPSFTTNGYSFAVTATTTNGPSAMVYDGSTNRLFLIDNSDFRVTVYDAASGTLANTPTAINVLGQTTFASTTNTVTQKNFGSAVYVMGATLDTTNNRLWVTDGNKNRILSFAVASGTIANGENASDALGQLNGDTPVYTTSATNNGGNGAASDAAIKGPRGMAVDETNHRLFVADQVNNRVLIYDLDGTNAISSRIATYVLGEPGFTTTAGGTTSSTLNTPQSIAYDPTNSRLFVADGNNNRVLVWNVATGTLANGKPAANVIGQTVFTTATSSVTSSTLGNALGIAYDNTNSRLFVGDNTGFRVLVYNLTSGITDGMPASNVLGQTSFTASSSATTSSTFSTVQGMAYDATSSRLFAVDGARVLVFDVTPATITNGKAASYVLGQQDFTSSGSGTTSSTLNSFAGFQGNIAYDGANQFLFVHDGLNRRVLSFNVATSTIATGEPASAVIGQADFTSSSSGTTSSTISLPEGATYESVGHHLFLGDYSNNRVLQFSLIKLATSSITIPTLSQKGSYSISLYFNPSNAQGTVTAAVSSGALPTGMSLSGGYLTGTPAGGTDGNYTFAFQVSDAVSGIGSFSDLSTSYSFAVSTLGVHSSSGGGSQTDPVLLARYLASLKPSTTPSTITAPSTPPQFSRETGEGQAPSLPRATSTFPTPLGVGTPTRSVGALLITKNLKLGTTDPQVKLLQVFLNTHGFILSLLGPGSQGNETNFFGRKTYQALIKFQEAHQKEILTPLGLTRGTGFFGVRTRGGDGETT